MHRPRHEPEIVRAKVAEAVEEIREDLRRRGFTEGEIAALSLAVERRSLRYAMAVQPDLGGAY